MRLFRSSKGLAAIVAGSLVFAFAVSSQAAAAPVRVASVAATDVGNGECDFDASGLGRGSATDPFLIGSPSDIAEIVDCSSSSTARREKDITGATGDGTTLTFTTADTHGAYGVGQVVTVSGMDPSGYNVTYARVISATETDFTVAGTETGTFNSGGAVKSEHDFYELTADIDLGSGTEAWNDTAAAAIAGVVDDGGTYLTYEVTDSSIFEAGESVSIKGHSNNDFNLGAVTIDSIPDPTHVKVASSATGTAGTGGTISRPGWDNFDVYDIDFDGKGYTISNLTIDNPDSYQGLFGSVYRSNIGNINFTGVDIDTTARGGSADYVGALAGRASGSGTSNISISGDIVATNEYVGMVIGYSQYGNHQSLSTSGTISFEAIDVLDNQDVNQMGHYAGGVFGYTYYESFVDIDSEVSVSGVTESADGTYKVYGDSIGGIFGRNDYSGLRNAYASGDVTGGRRVAGAVGADNCCSYTINATASGEVRAYSNSNWGAYGIGGFYGEEDCCSTRDNVTASGDVIVEGTADNTGGLNQIGGLMGYYGCCGLVMNSSSTGAVTVTNNGSRGRIEDIGGFMGAHYCCGDVLDSFSTGDVTVVNNSNEPSSQTFEIGGFIGEWSCCGTVRNSYSEGDVSVTVDESATYASRIGGFMGAAHCCGAADATYATGNVTVNYGYEVGGHTGYSYRGMQYIDSYATGNVTVTSGDRNGTTAGVGGFIGFSRHSTELTRVSATGDVALTTDAGSIDPTSAAGGLIGYADGNSTESHVLIKDSYYRGTVSGPSLVGGIIGDVDDVYVTVRAERVYTSAGVDATEVDGVVDPVASGKWTDPSGVNFFNSTLAGATESEVGFNARTTAQMKTAANYTAKGWSFTGDSNPWRIAAGTNEGYPYLVPVVMPRRGSGTDWTRVKTLSYAGSKVALTKSKKRALRQAATQLIADGCTKVQLRSRPNLNNYDVAAKRVKRAHTYLSQVFDNRGADLPIVSNVRVRPNSTNKNTVQVFCGAE